MSKVREFLSRHAPVLTGLGMFGIPLLAGAFVVFVELKADKYGPPASVTCFQSGVQIYVGRSAGKVELKSISKVWAFREAESNRKVRINAKCVVIYDEQA